MFAGCTKSDFLNKKPNNTIVEPTTIDDFIFLLDNTSNIIGSPGLGTLSADEYFYATQSEFDAALTQTEKNCYLWQKDIFHGENNRLDWNVPYTTILYSNVVLEGLKKLSSDNAKSDQAKFVRGWSLFNRGFAFFNLAQTFCDIYDSTTAAQDLGLPLKLTPDIDKLESRASLKATYERIESDITESIPLLPDVPSDLKNRPSKAAAFALLSRIHLFMQDIPNALRYSDSTLKYYSIVADFNELSKASNTPISKSSPEIILWSTQVASYRQTVTGTSSIAKIDTTLLSKYENNDLRKQIYFRTVLANGIPYSTMKRGYNGTASLYPFSGFATDEVLLTQAECLARIGQISDAVTVLNNFSINRYETGTYEKFQSSNQQEVLEKILTERRKELIWRGIRWNDIKRLNKMGASIILSRNLNGQTYTLQPNSPLYVMPIPQDEINQSHIQQNQR